MATLLSRLQKRGVLTHRTEGRQYVYRPLVSRDEVRESMLSALTHRLFRGDVTALLSHLLTESQITSGDLELELGEFLVLAPLCVIALLLGWRDRA